MSSEVSFAGGNSQSEAHHTFCRNSCIYHIYSHKLRVLTSHFLLKKFSHIYRYKTRWQNARRNGLMFSKTYEALGLRCFPVYRKKKPPSSISQKTEIMSSLLDFSLKNLTLSKKSQTNKKKTKKHTHKKNPHKITPKEQLSFSQKLFNISLHKACSKTPKPKVTAWHLMVS